MHSELPAGLQAPDAPRRFRLHGYQWIGLPLLFLVPALALLGVFGETWKRVEATGEDLALEVRYADRYRYKQINTVEAWVENRSGTRLDMVVVAFDPTYVRQFSAVAFIPTATEPFEVELYDLRPGERRLVWAELQAECYGWHRGSLQAYAVGHTDTASVALTTFVFP